MKYVFLLLAREYNTQKGKGDICRRAWMCVVIDERIGG